MTTQASNGSSNELQATKGTLAESHDTNHMYKDNILPSVTLGLV